MYILSYGNVAYNKENYKMIKHYITTKAFDYLNAGEIYKTFPIDSTHTRFWNEQKDCGTFIANWMVKQAIAQGLLKEIV